MGSSQREATFVAIGLVIVATLVVIYLINEPNRRDAAAEQKVDESAHRGIALYVQYCVACHAPDGSAQGEQPYLGVPLNLPQNQSEDEAEWEQREEIIRTTIIEGRGEIMPAWGQEEAGPLNEQQVDDLVNLIHEGLWEETEEQVVEANGGVIPTPQPAPTPSGDQPDDPQAAEGQQIYAANCQSCHTIDGGEATGPTWQGLFGSEVPLEGGETVTADEEYIRQSIVDPNAQIHEGYPPVMPSFEGRLTDEQIDAVIAYIQTLSE